MSFQCIDDVDVTEYAVCVVCSNYTFSIGKLKQGGVRYIEVGEESAGLGCRAVRWLVTVANIKLYNAPPSIS